MSRLTDRLLKDMKISPERQEIYEKLLSLDEDKDIVGSVTFDYGRRIGFGPSSNNYFGTVFWSSRTPLSIGVEVKLKVGFENLEELQKYLSEKGLPGKRAFQYCSSSYGIEFKEHDLDVHFGLQV